MRKPIIILLLFSSCRLMSQLEPQQFDSLDFFVRNKIKTVFCNYTSPTSILGEIRFHHMSFNKTANTFDGHSLNFRDSVYKRTGEQFNDTVKYFFDNKKRISKIYSVYQSEYGPNQTTTRHVYCDDFTNRLDSVISESDQMIYITKYMYENSLLKRAFFVSYTKYYESKDHSNSNSELVGVGNYIRDTTLPYAYYKNLQLKGKDLSKFTTNQPEKGILNPKLPNEYYLYVYNYTRYKWPDSESGNAPVSVFLYEYYPDNKPKRQINISLNGRYRGYVVTDYFYDTY